MEIIVLSAGAVEEVVKGSEADFFRETGHTLKATFAPVGALREAILAGEQADLAILTPPAITVLEAQGLVAAQTRRDLGRMGGGIAVRRGAQTPKVGTAEELKETLLRAEEIYYGDPEIATAGAHFLKVADSLGIGEEVRKKGRTAPGGRAAMKAMAASTREAVGLTQISEILSVPEVVLVGPYPEGLQAMTTYAGVVLKGAAHPQAAEAFLSFLLGPAIQARFRQSGFEAPA